MYAGGRKEGRKEGREGGRGDRESKKETVIVRPKIGRAHV